MKTNKKLLINLLSVIFLITLLASCSKEKIDKKETSDIEVSDQLYKQKLQALTVSNNSKAQELGINFIAAKDTIRQSFKSYQQAYEFIAALKKGISSTRVDTATTSKSLNKTMSSLAVANGVDNVFYNVNCSNAAPISGTWGTGSITGTWVVSGSLGYSYTQNSSTSPKVYKTVMPIGTSLSVPFMAYSGVGAMTASAGGWNGSAASYTMQRNAQVTYSITTGGTTINGSVALVITFTSNISWTPAPQTVYVNHSMSAQAY
ncbi:hypothetical protein QF042_003757 [Pedobacter sp. W3I1]|uniref:hypothetical protein n=1 Tax=Pedobacter sp. W3I1 TaxID=3042291 RepID=UPI002780DF02|nr:hypothetical protein [Pedobacter sp. W3I1]MDQ0640192.1 hypothetical protein [Pedobacter sp. W3I1]